ncbi:unnamed protein product [Gadus morhua 'NCC']
MGLPPFIFVYTLQSSESVSQLLGVTMSVFQAGAALEECPDAAPDPFRAPAPCTSSSTDMAPPHAPAPAPAPVPVAPVTWPRAAIPKLGEVEELSEFPILERQSLSIDNKASESVHP